LSWPSEFDRPTRPVKAQAARVQASQPAAKEHPMQQPRACQHVNRKGQVYYLHEGQTKNGKPKYFFSKQTEGHLCSDIPDGFELYENVRGQVFCRRTQPKLINDQEVAVVREAIRRHGKHYLAAVEVKKKDIIVYEREHPVLRFTLEDDTRRSFSIARWCFRGSVDDWHELFIGPKPLAELADRYCRHIGEDSFYELM
ncbi:MAG: hypothetical protein O3B86_19120, partial [Planctomycetota bacterium]|nr:hypothetical protein [Planctomycetota bacterium]